MVCRFLILRFVSLPVSIKGDGEVGMGVGGATCVRYPLFAGARSTARP